MEMARWYNCPWPRGEIRSGVGRDTVLVNRAVPRKFTRKRPDRCRTSTRAMWCRGRYRTRGCRRSGLCSWVATHRSNSCTRRATVQRASEALAPELDGNAPLVGAEGGGGERHSHARTTVLGPTDDRYGRGFTVTGAEPVPTFEQAGVDPVPVTWSLCKLVNLCRLTVRVAGLGQYRSG